MSVFSPEAAKTMSKWTDVGLLRALFYAVSFSVFVLLDDRNIPAGRGKGLSLIKLTEVGIVNFSKPVG